MHKWKGEKTFGMRATEMDLCGKNDWEWQSQMQTMFIIHSVAALVWVTQCECVHGVCCTSTSIPILTCVPFRVKFWVEILYIPIFHMVRHAKNHMRFSTSVYGRCIPVRHRTFCVRIVYVVLCICMHLSHFLLLNFDRRQMVFVWIFVRVPHWILSISSH